MKPYEKKKVSCLWCPICNIWSVISGQKDKKRKMKSGENYSKVSSAPQWLKDRMEALRKRPFPTAEQVERQFRASAKFMEKEYVCPKCQCISSSLDCRCCNVVPLVDLSEVVVNQPKVTLEQATQQIKEFGK